MSKNTAVQSVAAMPAATEATTVITNGIVLNAEQKKLFDPMQTKSERIRYLASLGYKNGPIAKFLSIVYGKPMKYQHARNVLNQKLKGSTNLVAPADPMQGSKLIPASK